LVLIFCEPCFNVPNNVSFLHIRRLVRARTCSNKSSSLRFVTLSGQKPQRGSSSKPMRGCWQAFVSFRRSQTLVPKMSSLLHPSGRGGRACSSATVICQELNSTGGIGGVSVLEVGIDLLLRAKICVGQPYLRDKAYHKPHLPATPLQIEHLDSTPAFSFVRG
jgi:hypothetical protein